MKKIDINCDLGEKENLIDLADDRLIMSYISSCNVSCAFHSGTPFIIEESIKCAIENNVKIGAHPSYDDRLNYGRLSINVEAKILKSQIKYQISAIKGMVETYGEKLHHVKAHGALYNDMARDSSLALLFANVVKEIDPNLLIYGMPGSVLENVCKEVGMSFCREAFADRRYDALATLRSRKLDGSVLENEQDVLHQIGNFLEGKVRLHSGKNEAIKVETICIHSDTKGALSLTKAINQFIKSKNINIG